MRELYQIPFQSSEWEKYSTAFSTAYQKNAEINACPLHLPLLYSLETSRRTVTFFMTRPSLTSLLLCSAVMPEELMTRPCQGVVAEPRQPSAWGLLGQIWLWFRLWVKEGQRGFSVPFDGRTPTVKSRTLRARRQHFAKRRARGKAVPASRDTTIYHYFGSPFAAPLSPTQFLERLCRLSGHARHRLYRMRYITPRRVREARHSRFVKGGYVAPGGVWAAHLWPE